jgi:hypothetical protein
MRTLDTLYFYFFAACALGGAVRSSSPRIPFEARWGCFSSS